MTSIGTKILLDTCDIDEIKKYSSIISGITMNPSIMKKCGVSDIKSTLRKVDEVIPSKPIFYQISKEEEHRELIDVRYNIVYKIPLLFEYYDLIRSLENDANICGTCTYDLFQFYMACEMSLDYCIVLLAKNPDKDFLDKCIEFRNKKYGGYPQIIAASFREKSDVIDTISKDVDYISIPPTVLGKCCINLDAYKELQEHGK